MPEAEMRLWVNSNTCTEGNSLGSWLKVKCTKYFLVSSLKTMSVPSCDNVFISILWSFEKRLIALLEVSLFYKTVRHLNTFALGRKV